MQQCMLISRQLDQPRQSIPVVEAAAVSCLNRRSSHLAPTHRSHARHLTTHSRGTRIVYILVPSTKLLDLMLRFLVTLILSLASVDALARISCDKAITTPDINQCARKSLDRAEAILNKTYRGLLARLANDGRDFPDFAQARVELIKAQRIWITYREADCTAIYTLWQSGTIRSLMHLSCMQSHAEQRTKELALYTQDTSL